MRRWRSSRTSPKTVAALARTLYPHVALPDSVYARVPAKLDEAAREDAAQAQIVNEGVADLDGRGDAAVRRSARPSSSSPTPRRIAGSDFFELVRSTAVVEIYSDPQTWKLLGYEGPSFDAGRLHRPRLQRPRLAPRPRAGGVSDAALR